MQARPGEVAARASTLMLFVHSQHGMVIVVVSRMAGPARVLVAETPARRPVKAPRGSRRLCLSLRTSSKGLGRAPLRAMWPRGAAVRTRNPSPKANRLVSLVQGRLDTRFSASASSGGLGCGRARRRASLDAGRCGFCGGGQTARARLRENRTKAQVPVAIPLFEQLYIQGPRHASRRRGLSREPGRPP